MNAKTVIQKLMTLLEKQEVAFTYARLKDGTIVESPTFDVGEPVEVVSEDGTKTPAPDGEHELALKDSEGNETLIKVFTEGGVITERENVELEVEDAEMLPEEGEKEIPTEMEAEVYETSQGDIPQSGDGIPADVSQGDVVGVDEDIAKTIEALSYRIEELEKQLKMKVDEEVVDKDPTMEEEMAEVEIEVKEEEEEDLPKLDGAPIEAVKKFAKLQTNDKSNVKNVSAQERFLMKMYNK
jgi:hypothetical protein